MQYQLYILNVCTLKCDCCCRQLQTWVFIWDTRFFMELHGFLCGIDTVSGPIRLHHLLQVWSKCTYIYSSTCILFVVCILLYVPSIMHILYVQWFALCSWLYTGTSILTTIIFVESKLDIKVSLLFGAFNIFIIVS